MGYAVDANSQVLKEKHHLSPVVENVRKSAHDAMQFSADPDDDRRLILNTPRQFLLLSQAVEMICGFLPKKFPRETDWKSCSSWESEPKIIKQETPENNVPLSESLHLNNGESVSSLEINNNGWIIVPNVSVEIKVEDLVFNKGDIDITEEVSAFLGAPNLAPGHDKRIQLRYNSKKYFGSVIKIASSPQRIKLHIDLRLRPYISEFCSSADSDKIIKFEALRTKSRHLHIYDVYLNSTSPEGNESKTTVVENPKQNKIEDNHALSIDTSTNLKNVLDENPPSYDSNESFSEQVFGDYSFFPPQIVTGINADWSIIPNKRIAIRHINPKYPLSTGTPLPPELNDYFEISSVPYNQTIGTSLRYNSVRYDGTIRRLSEQTEARGLAARLEWSDVVQNALRDFYNPQSQQQSIVFRKDEDVYEFELEFVDQLFLDANDFESKSQGVPLEELIVQFKDLLSVKNGNSIYSHLLISAIISFCAEYPDWGDNPEAVDEHYVYVPFSEILKKWLEHLIPFVYSDNYLYLSSEEVENHNFIPFRQNLKYILDYYMNLTGSISLLSDLEENTIPRGLNESIHNLLESVGNVLCNDAIQNFGSTIRGESNIIAIGEKTSTKGYLAVINHSFNDIDADICAIKKDWYYLFNSSIGLSLISSGVLGSKIYDQLIQLNPGSEENLINILSHLSLINPEYVSSDDSALNQGLEGGGFNDSDSSLSPEIESLFTHKSYIPTLKKQLTKLGLENYEASIFSVFIYYSDDELTKAHISQSCSVDKDKFDRGIFLLTGRNYIRSFKEKNSNGRTVTYYQRDLPLDAVYTDLLRRNNDLLTRMKKDRDTLSAILNSGSNPKSFEDVLSSIGFASDVSKILVKLKFSSSTPAELAHSLSSEIDVKKLSNYIGELHSRCWIKKTSYRTAKIPSYGLNKTLDKIASEYIDAKTIEIEQTLSEFKLFVDFRKKNPVSISDSDALIPKTKSNNYAAGNSGRPSDRIKKYNEIFLDSIKQAVISHSSVDEKPLNIKLELPHPTEIRVYLFKVIESRKNDVIEIKSLLHLPGQKVSEKAHLNFDDTSFVLLCGYYEELELFVLWDATLHGEFAYSTSVHVARDNILEAEIIGISTYERNLRDKGIETVVVATREKLLEAIDEHYSRYIEKLLA